MKKILKIAFVVLLITLSAQLDTNAQCVNCPPPPPPAHGVQLNNAEVGLAADPVCAPIDGGWVLLILMGVAYGAYKSRKILLLK